ncbi:MAG: molecular chaperone DnaJ [Gemmatimonadota bacterium]|nr:molecular chaperone DnaJ [Gemmatimonadota bacterium]
MADFYSTLGVERTAADDEIKKSYRKLAMAYHPDRNGGSKEAEEKFKEITEAYDVLRDPQKRATYDRYGEAGLRGGGGGGFHHVDLSEALGIFMRDFGGFGGLDDLFGGQGRGQRGGNDVRIAMPLTLAEVATGVEKEVRIKVLDACEACSGTGAEPGSKAHTCTTCAGHGEVRRAQRSFFGQFVAVTPCPSCHGEGKQIDTPCKRCKGDGRTRSDKTIKVSVPAGVATGQYMTLRGVGNIGARKGERGDVHVVFEVADDARFEREGEDLFTEVLVTYPQLVMGAVLQVPTATSTVALTIPPSTQSGQMFHLRGRGLARVNAAGTGDLHVRVQLWTPDSLTAEEQDLIARLGQLQRNVPSEREKGLWAKMKEALGA